MDDITVIDQKMGETRIEENSAATVENSTIESRLGKCEVCNFATAKYTCPKCELKTCTLSCIQIHKKELDCSGIRDKTKYIPKQNFTENIMMSDYTFLEDCTQYTHCRKGDKIKKFTQYNRTLPVHMIKLEAAAKERGTILKYMLQNFTKHKLNTTYYNWMSKVIEWRIEWHFVNANGAKFVDDRCSEHSIIVTLLENRMEANGALGSGILDYYQAKGVANLRVLLKAEGIRKSKNRFYEFDIHRTLGENLKGKTIIEFPVIHVIYCTDTDDLDIINSDDDDVNAETRTHKEHYFKKTERGTKRHPTNQNTNVNGRAKKATRNLEPKNFLFTDENMDWSDNSDTNDQAV